jgi:hypothetical protein
METALFTLLHSLSWQQLLGMGTVITIELCAIAIVIGYAFELFDISRIISLKRLQHSYRRTARQQTGSSFVTATGTLILCDVGDENNINNA